VTLRRTGYSPPTCCCDYPGCFWCITRNM
jgi:hypothetical protein